MPPGTIAEVLAPALAEAPDRPALVAPDRTLSYAELDAEANRAAGALRDLGLRRGDRIAVSLPNDSRIVVLFHAVMRAGGIWVGLSGQLAPPEQQALLDHARASIAIGCAAGPPSSASRRTLTPPDWARALNGARPVPPGPADPHAAAAIAYTSGTTGQPKGVVHSQHNLLVPGAVLAATRGYDTALRKADSLPMTILNLLVLSTLLTSQARGTAIISDARRAGEVAGWLRATGATVWNGVPALLHDMARDPAIPSSSLDGLTEVWAGGDNLSEEIRAAFGHRFAPPLTGTYGLTEAPTVVAIEDRHAPHVPGGSGQVLPHLRVFTSPAGDGAAAEGLGELCVTGRDDGPWAGVYRPMLGYWDDPQATARALAGGVLATGDLGTVSDDGQVSVRDRSKLVIVRGGANVYPAEVERVIGAHAGAVASAVFATADTRLGSRVAAVVQARGPGLDVDDLRRHCLARLARYKVPETWHVTTGPLPRNAMGKIDRAAVTARWAGR